MKNITTFLLLLTFSFAQAKYKAVDLSGNTGNIFSNKPKFQQTKWSGKYYAEAKNRDGLKTSFDIQINTLQDVSLIYVSDSENAEHYKNLKAVQVDANKIRIVFNKKYKNLGMIYLEKLGDQYRLLGEPVYFINPGNESLRLKKLK
jgi:hypothetical protein